LSAVATLPALPGSSTPGYFDPGDPVSERDATILDYAWANRIQEELAAIVEQGAGGTLDRTNNAQVLAAIRALIAAIPHGIQTISATAWFTVPSPTIEVEIWAGGSGSWASISGIAGGGGSGGGYAKKRGTDLTVGATIAVTIGGGGNAGTAGVAPTSGGASSFGSYCSATGGQINPLTSAGSPGWGTSPDLAPAAISTCPAAMAVSGWATKPVWCSIKAASAAAVHCPAASPIRAPPARRGIPPAAARRARAPGRAAQRPIRAGAPGFCIVRW
jgi:hypothetical protein